MVHLPIHKGSRVGYDVYVGSTNNIKRRLLEHRSNANNKNLRSWNYKPYQRMREVGVEEWDVIPIITFFCDKNTIRECEDLWIKALSADLNTFSAHSDLDKAEYKAEWYQKNRDTYLRRINERYQRNKDEEKFYCEICKLAFGSNYSLERHTESKSHYEELMYGLE